MNLESVEKEGEKLQKFEYLENEKSFLDEIKNIFHSFWRAIIRWKNKNLIKNSGHKFNNCVLHFWPKGHKEPHIEVGSLSLPKHLVGFELGTFQFLQQHLNPLGQPTRPLLVSGWKDKSIHSTYLIYLLKYILAP